MYRRVIVSIVASSLFAQSEVLELPQKYVEEGRFNEAFDLYTEIYTRFKDEELGKTAFFRRAELELLLGDTLLAKRDLLSLVGSKLSDTLGADILETLIEITKDSSEKAEYLFDYALRYPLEKNRKIFLENSARLFEERGEYKRALTCYKILASDYPGTHDDYQYKIARMRWLTGDNNRAKLILERGNTEEKRTLLSRILLEEGDTGLAYQLVEPLENPEAIFLKGTILSKLGYYEFLLNQIKDIDEDKKLIRLKVDSYLRLGRIEDALPLEEDIEDTLLLAELYLKSGRPKEGIQILEGNPSNNARYIRAVLYTSIGDTLKAYLEARELPDKNIYNLFKLKLVDYLIEKKLYREANSLLEDISRVYPMDSLITKKYRFFTITGAHKERKRILMDAERWGVKLIMKPTEDYLYRVQKETSSRVAFVKRLFEDRAFFEVVRVLHKGKIKPEEAILLSETLINLFEITRDTIYASKAERILEQFDSPPDVYYRLHSVFRPSSVKADSIDTTTLSELGKVYIAKILLKQGHPTEALKIIRKLPNNRERRKLLFEYFLQENILDSAYKYTNLGNYKEVYSLGKRYWGIGEYKLSGELLRRIPWEGYILGEKSHFLDILNNYKIHKLDELRNTLSLFLKIYPESRKRELQRLIGYINFREGNYTKAYLYLLPFEDTTALKLKAHSLLELGRLEDAKKANPNDEELLWKLSLYETDLSKLPSSFPPQDKKFLLSLLERVGEGVFDSLADTLIKENFLTKNDVVFIEFERAFKRGDSTRYMDLVDSLSEDYKKRALYEIALAYMKKGELDEAMQRFDSLLYQTTGTLTAKIYFKLGTLSYVMGDIRSALLYYINSREKSQSDSLTSLILYNIALCYKNLNKRDSSKIYYKDIIDLFPEDEISLQAKVSLINLLFEEGELDSALKLLEDIEGELRNEEMELQLKDTKADILFNSGRINSSLLENIKISNFYKGYPNWAITAKLKSANLFLILGREKKAKKILKEILEERGEEDPFGQEAKNRLEKLSP